MPEGNPASPPAAYAVPPHVRAHAAPLLASFADLVHRMEAFAVQVADPVRSDPAAVARLLQQLARVPSALFPRWTLEILYLLSLQAPLRYGQLRAHLPGIANRSLSLKLDELERQGLLDRRVEPDRHVAYALTPRGRALARLSFPLVLHLNLEHGLGDALGAPSTEDRPAWS